MGYLGVIPLGALGGPVMRRICFRRPCSWCLDDHAAQQRAQTDQLQSKTPSLAVLPRAAQLRPQPRHLLGCRLGRLLRRPRGWLDQGQPRSEGRGQQAGADHCQWECAAALAHQQRRHGRTQH